MLIKKMMIMTVKEMPVIVMETVMLIQFSIILEVITFGQILLTGLMEYLTAMDQKPL